VTDGEGMRGGGGAREEPILITRDMLAATGTPGRGRIDFERGMRPLPPLILCLIAVNIAMFAWEIAAGALADRDTIIEAGALVRDRILVDGGSGEWWRVVSSMFLHGSIDHVLGNVIVLFIVGMACEHAFGGARTALIYFTSGITGALVSLAAGPGPSVGASGAIFGVIAAVIVVLYRHQDRFYVRDKRIGFVLAVWAAWQIVTGLANPFIDNFAHVGGLAGGALATLPLRPRLLPSGTQG
jgi:rhomboid protease GluP